MLTNLLAFPVVWSLWHGRRAMLYDLPFFCGLFGMFLKMQASFSVFLVAVLSLTRSMILVRPFCDISTRRVLWVVAGYTSYLLLNQLLPLVFGWTTFLYTETEVYCWDEGASVVLDHLDTWLDLVSLAVPVVPITISCVVSCVYVRVHTLRTPAQFHYGAKATGSTKSGTTTSNLAKHKATLTIILMTIVYIIFNIPLFLNYCLWLVIETHRHWSYPEPFYCSGFMYWYSWNLTDSLFLNLNSLVNPLVYFSRIRKFREWVTERYVSGRKVGVRFISTWAMCSR